MCAKTEKDGGTGMIMLVLVPALGSANNGQASGTYTVSGMGQRCSGKSPCGCMLHAACKADSTHKKILRTHLVSAALQYRPTIIADTTAQIALHIAAPTAH